MFKWKRVGRRERYETTLTYGERAECVGYVYPFPGISEESKEKLVYFVRNAKREEKFLCGLD